MEIPVPHALSVPISDRAAQIAREKVQFLGWKSSGAIMARPATGSVGIQVTAPHLIYQSRGFGPFLMKELEGKTIPMNGGFRRVHGVGQPGWVTLPGGVRDFRQQKWRHPGLQGKHFLEDAIKQAIEEYRPTLQEELLKWLKGDSGDRTFAA